MNDTQSGPGKKAKARVQACTREGEGRRRNDRLSGPMKRARPCLTYTHRGVAGSDQPIQRWAALIADRRVRSYAAIRKPRAHDDNGEAGSRPGAGGRAADVGGGVRLLAQPPSRAGCSRGSGGRFSAAGIHAFSLTLHLGDIEELHDWAVHPDAKARGQREGRQQGMDGVRPVCPSTHSPSIGMIHTLGSLARTVCSRHTWRGADVTYSDATHYSTHTLSTVQYRSGWSLTCVP